MNSGVLFSCLLTLMLVSSCSANKELRTQRFKVSSDTPNPAKAPGEFYVLGAGDIIGINVWGEAALSGSAKIRPDGLITLPLINEVVVAGMTTGQLRTLLEEKYKGFVTDPLVTVRVESITSTEIFLIGQVNRPGAYPLNGSDTVLQLLTRAGGLKIFADRDNIRVVRRMGDEVTEYTVDYDAIIKGDLKQDILLRPGDRIIVR